MVAGMPRSIEMEICSDENIKQKRRVRHDSNKFSSHTMLFASGVLWAWTSQTSSTVRTRNGGIGSKKGTAVLQLHTMALWTLIVSTISLSLSRLITLFFVSYFLSRFYSFNFNNPQEKARWDSRKEVVQRFPIQGDGGVVALWNMTETECDITNWSRSYEVDGGFGGGRE